MSVIGIGTQFWRAGGSSEQIAGVTEIGEVSATSDTLETTTYGSTGGYREYIAGLKDGGEVGMTLLFNQSDSSQAQLVTDFENGAVVGYELRLPTADNDIIGFSGIITNLSQAIPLEERITRSISIKITGPISFTTGSNPDSANTN